MTALVGSRNTAEFDEGSQLHKIRCHNIFLLDGAYKQILTNFCRPNSSNKQNELVTRSIIWGDLALLKTTESIKFSNTVGAAKIFGSYIDLGTATSVAGWGTPEMGLPTQTQLQSVDMKTIDKDECLAVFSVQDRNVSNIKLQMSDLTCTVGEQCQSICTGDSGSALVLRESQEIIGVTSFVMPNGCNLNKPAGFTNVTFHTKWITKITGIKF